MFDTYDHDDDGDRNAADEDFYIDDDDDGDDADADGDDDDDDDRAPWDAGNHIRCHLHLTPAQSEFSANQPAGFSADPGSCNDGPWYGDWTNIRSVPMLDVNGTCNVKKPTFDLVAGSGRGCTKGAVGGDRIAVDSQVGCMRRCTAKAWCLFFEHEPTTAATGSCWLHANCDFERKDLAGRVYRRKGVAVGDLIKSGPDLEAAPDDQLLGQGPSVSTTTQAAQSTTVKAPLTVAEPSPAANPTPPRQQTLSTQARGDGVVGNSGPRDRGSGDSDSNVGIIVGACIAAVAAVCLLAGLIVWRRRQKTVADPRIAELHGWWNIPPHNTTLQ